MRIDAIFNPCDCADDTRLCGICSRQKHEEKMDEAIGYFNSDCRLLNFCSSGDRIPIPRCASNILGE